MPDIGVGFGPGEAASQDVPGSDDQTGRGSGVVSVAGGGPKNDTGDGVRRRVKARLEACFFGHDMTLSPDWLVSTPGDRSKIIMFGARLFRYRRKKNGIHANSSFHWLGYYDITVPLTLQYLVPLVRVVVEAAEGYVHFICMFTIHLAFFEDW